MEFVIESNFILILYLFCFMLYTLLNIYWWILLSNHEDCCVCNYAIKS